LYPEPRSRELREAVAGRYGVPADSALIGNGSDEVLSILFRCLLEPGDGIVTAWPTYSLYPTLTEILGAHVEAIDVREDWRMDLPAMLAAVQNGALTAAKSPGPAPIEAGDAGGSSPTRDSKRRPLAIITNPNAPTSLLEKREAVLNSPARIRPSRSWTKPTPISATVRWQAWPAALTMRGSLVCGTFSKTYSLAGGRVGWLLAHPAIIAELDKVRDSYNVNRLTQTAALAALKDQGELKRRIETIKATRGYTVDALARLGFETLPGQANFIFTRPPAGFAGGKNPDGGSPESPGQCCYEHLRERKILVRYFSGPRTGEFVRITIGTRGQMERLVAVAAELV
jgi:histidinol-phosphate aminotransferase